MELNPVFERYLAEAVGEDKARIAMDAFDLPASVSIRYNPFKCKLLGNYDQSRVMPFEELFDGEVKWCKSAYYLSERPVFTLDPLFHAGCYYVQDSSAMFPGYVLRSVLDKVQVPLGRPIRVLDLCAAPGGKTTDAVSSLRTKFGENFLLVANEIMKQRASLLAENTAIWGDPNVVVTSLDPTAFASLPGYFDIIIADVPCSGEGMFRKDEEAVRQWSEANVELCRARQRRIVADVWPTLAPGGVLIYSTCTFNRLENDTNVEWITQSLGADPLVLDAGFEEVLKTEFGYALVSGLVRGEGQYCAAVVKHDSDGYSYASRHDRKKPQSANVLSPAICANIEKMFINDVIVSLSGDMVVATPRMIDEDLGILSALKPLRKGTAVGRIKGKDLVPDADLALCLNLDRNSFESVSLTRDEALRFLHKDPLILPNAPHGVILLTYNEVALGFVKNLGNRTNSLLPQNRRIRMDVR